MKCLFGHKWIYSHIDETYYGTPNDLIPREWIPEKEAEKMTFFNEFKDCVRIYVIPIRFCDKCGKKQAKESVLKGFDNNTEWKNNNWDYRVLSKEEQRNLTISKLGI